MDFLIQAILGFFFNKNYKKRAPNKMHAISAAAQHRIEAVAQGNGGCFDNNLGYF